jgi:hypothetical protein
LSQLVFCPKTGGSCDTNHLPSYATQPTEGCTAFLRPDDQSLVAELRTLEAGTASQQEGAPTIPCMPGFWQK